MEICLYLGVMSETNSLVNCRFNVFLKKMTKVLTKEE
jgi:hypothetical protein